MEQPLLVAGEKTISPVVWLLILSFLLGASLPSSISAAAEAVPPAVEEDVKSLRENRHRQMPYLDWGIIRGDIREEDMEAAAQFRALERKNLTEVLDRAAGVHIQAQAARERISLAHRRVVSAFRNLLPEVEFQWEEQDGDLSARPFNHMSYRFNFRQPIYRGGALWNTLLQERAEVDAAKKEYEAVVADLVNDVSAAYFELQRTLQVLRAQDEMLQKIKRFADISQQKFSEGLISEIEHLNVQSLWSQAQYDYETAKQETEVAKLELLKFLDLGLETDLAVKELYDMENLLAGESKEKQEGDKESIRALEDSRTRFGGLVDLPPISELVDLAYQNRPELRVEAARLKSARFEERVRWGELLPHADLVLEFGKIGEAFDDLSVDPGLRKDLRAQLEFEWNAMGNTFGYQIENDENAPTVSQFQGGSGSQITRNTITVGVLDGLDALVEAKEAEADRLDQVVQLEEAEKEVVLDVKQAYYDLQKAKIQVKSSIQRVNYRKRLAELAFFRLEKNEIETSEYLQAEIDLLGELGTLHQALADYFTAKSRLNRAVGIPNYLPIEERYGA